MIKNEEEEEELKQYLLTHIKKDKRKSKKFKLKDDNSTKHKVKSSKKFNKNND